MYPTQIARYLTYSSLVHIIFIFSLLMINLSKKSEKVYYAVDFMGGGIAPAASPAASIQEQESEEIKTKIVNPAEDLLLKSRKKPSKNEKEIVTTTPPIPTAPIPPRAQGRTDSTNPSVIPGLGDGGVGIGLGDAGSGGGTGNFPYVWYVQSVKKKLDSNWNVTTGFSVKIYTQVIFTIKRDGSLSEIEVEESSKNDVFDRAALRAVEYASPLPPLPSGFPESELRVHVRFTVKR